MRQLLVLLVIGILAACSSDGPPPQPTVTAPVARGDRMLSIDISLPEDDDYTAAFERAFATDMDQVKLSIDWKDLRDDMDLASPTFAPAVNAFYHTYAMPIVVFIRPIHIDSDHRPTLPTDLTVLAMNDASVVAAFNQLIDDFMAAIPNTTVDAIIIGSEIDGYLGNNATRWTEYTDFFDQTATHIRSTYSGVKVGSEVTFPLLKDAAKRVHWNTLCGYADFTGISYYGIDYATLLARSPQAIADDFALIAANCRSDRDIWIPQMGYPSGANSGSSEALQADWVSQAFLAWDRWGHRITMVNFTWMHEWLEADVDAFLVDVGISGNAALKSFLLSLGLRHRTGSGSDKPAWTRLLSETAARGWQRSVVSPIPAISH
ncbi:MAG: hypothetical protein PF961_05525 [Planctomycetota bacterium]|jgi:hypothetical protein|nr:hypothetical protein [Planctomycetota bacterium]